MSQDYTEKYLKYKNKYLNLKTFLLNKEKQLGGGLNNNDFESLENLTQTPLQTEVYGRILKSSFLSNMEFDKLKLEGGNGDASNSSKSNSSESNNNSESHDSSSHNSSGSHNSTQTGSTVSSVTQSTHDGSASLSSLAT